MMQKFIFHIMLSTCLLLSACDPNPQAIESVAHIPLPNTQVGDLFNVVIETSAGEHFPQVYDMNNGLFSTADSAAHSLFLPYPVNAGFIPLFESADSALVKIPTWVFSKRVEVGEVVQTIPLAVLEYAVRDVPITSFVMIPAEDSLNAYDITKFETLSIQRDALKYAFEYWLRHKAGVGSISRIQWSDQVDANRQLVELINN